MRIVPCSILLTLAACAGPAQQEDAPLQFSLPTLANGEIRNIAVETGGAESILGAEVVLFDDDGNGRFEPHEELIRNAGTLTKPSSFLRFGTWTLPRGARNPMMYWRVQTKQGLVERSISVN